MVSASLSAIAGAILSQILYQIPVCLWDYLSRDPPSREVANNVREVFEDANQKQQHKTMQSEEINQDEADTSQSQGRKRWISFRAKGQKRHRVSSSESLKQPLGFSFSSSIQLQMLRRIELKKCRNCSRFPQQLGMLPYLEYLELKEMDNITIEGNDTATMIFPSLKKLKLIKLSSISFEGMSLSSSSSSSSMQPGGRKLFPLLVKITVRDCDVVNGLPWPMLSQLSILHIEDSRGLDAQLPGCLKDLKSLNRLMIIGSKCKTLFDNRDVMATLERLNDVTVEDCNELISVDGLQVLPSLTTLHIRSCRKLRCWWVEEEVLLPKLSHLYLEYCEDLESVPACLLLLPSLAFLSISDCRKLRRWCASEQGVFLPKLSHLCIRNCEDLESMPACLPHLPSLEHLEIEKCPKVHSLPEGGLPSSMRRFVINRCDPGLMERCKQELLSNPEWQMIQEQEYITFERKHKERNEEADLSP